MYPITDRIHRSAVPGVIWALVALLLVIAGATYVGTGTTATPQLAPPTTVDVSP